MNGHSAVGKVGHVVTKIRGGESPGEVRVVVAGLPHYYLAYSPSPLAVDTQVLVIGSRGARQIDVEPWAHISVDVADAQFHSERK